MVNLFFTNEGQIKIYDPTTEELQEATFYDQNVLEF